MKRLGAALPMLMVAAIPSELVGQGSNDIRPMMASIRQAKSAYGAERTLGQSGGAPSGVVIDLLADSLVAIAIEAGNKKDASQSNLRVSAVSAIGESGSERSRVPYKGATLRLLRIAQQASDRGIRAAAVGRMSGLVDTSGALRALRQIASSNNPVAVEAVRTLWDAMSNKGGLAVLRELSTSNDIASPYARQELDRVARKYGWKT